MQFFVVAALAALFVASCSGGDGSPDAKPDASASVEEAQPTPAAAPGEPNIGAQITRADISASIPVTSDGRRWYPAAGSDDQILLSAQRDVPPVPGEPVGQGPARYDQQFWLWNPLTGERRLAWTNDGNRYEMVTGVDGDWALGYLYKNMPGNQWTLRLHNLSTGEQRNVSSLHPAAQGIDSFAGVIGSGRLAYVHKIPGADGSLVERVELYDIEKDTTTTLSETATGLDGGSSPWMSISARKVAWTEPSEAAKAGSLHVYDIDSGTTTEVAGDDQHAWAEVASNGAFVLGMPPGGGGYRYFARALAGGPVTTYLEAAVSMLPAKGKYVSWIGQGTPTDLRGYYDIPRNTLHILAPDIPVRGQTSGIVDGWFYWVEPGPDDAQSFEGGTLHVIRLP